MNDLIFLAQIAIPIAVLSVMLRARMARGAVADLVVELGQTPTPARLRDALANALGDPSLQVAYWAPARDRFVDAAGEPMELPEDGTGQAVTMLERNGVREAAIIHDAILLEEPGLIASVASAMRLAVENDRLTAEVEAQLEEVRASRARIVEAGDLERRRVERDLHDGAQQRLVSLSLELRVARSALGDGGDPAVRRSLDRAADEALAALAELRDLALGIHPLILTESGLGEAVESLADRTPVDVSVDVGPERYSPAVEGAAYFVISEALANVTKYAKATKALVRVRRPRRSPEHRGRGRRDRRRRPSFRQRPARSCRPPGGAGWDDHGRQPARWRNADLGPDPDHSTYAGPRVSPVGARSARMARWAA